MAHQTEELEKQADIIKRFEAAYAQSTALVSSKDEELSLLVY